VEAYRVADAKGFTLAVQWHPEWRFSENPDSVKLFRAFGDACRAYKAPDNNNERSKWQFAKTLPTPTWTCG
jgi:hypothetical protein